MKWIKPSTYENPIYPYRHSPDQDSPQPTRHQVVIVGAGPIGLVLALDLAQHQIPSVILDEDNTVSIGSRAICFAKRTLEIVDRLGAGERMLEKGVTWNRGKIFFRDDLVFEFNLLPEEGHKVPAFINLQQYYFEEYLVDEVLKNPLIDLRWKNRVNAVTNSKNGVALNVGTPEEDYSLEADYLLACDGTKSPVREMLTLSYTGEKYEENFLIADVTMKSDFPTERWFWFDPPFNPGQSALLHKQPDDMWRIDLQLGRDIDQEKELDPERIKWRLRQMLGKDAAFELEWTSIYQFKCLRMDKFIYDRAIFVGDSAHQVSPFGARGANGGVQDADNLAWKLALVLHGIAPASLLDTYNQERSMATDENIKYSSQATDFISPKSEISLVFRNAVLEMANLYPSVRKIINSGRLSQPYKYLDSPLTTPDLESFAGNLQPGYAASDFPLVLSGKNQWFLSQLGRQFMLVFFGNEPPTELHRLSNLDIPVGIMHISTTSGQEGVFIDQQELFAKRYDAREGTWYLFRPDQHIAARGRTFDLSRIKAEIDVATGKKAPVSPTQIIDQSPDYVGDDLYIQLIKAHEGLTKEESDHLNAKLVLFLLEKVETSEALDQLIEQAKEGITSNL